MISFKHRGSLKKTTIFLKNADHIQEKEIAILRKYGEKGVAALKANTPLDSGETANSWYYEIVRNNEDVSIEFNNDNVNNGVPIAIILQYGHGTRNGGYVEGRDYINPAVQPIFDEIAEEARREVEAL